MRSRLFWTVVAIAALAAFHPAILRTCARLLVVDQRGSSVSHLVLLGGDRQHDVAADFVRQNPRGRILLIESEPTTLVECGIVPTDDALDRRALAERGVPVSAIELVPGAAADAWEEMRQLRQWLADHSDVRAAVLCDRFDSRSQQAVADTALSPDQAQRVTVWALPKREFDERNWWRTRSGARQFVYAWLRLTFHTLRGEPQAKHRHWDPDEYEESGVRSQESGVRSQESGVRSQESAVRVLLSV